MKIGFVSTWFERGAAYVTKQYMELLKDDHDVFVYARGGEQYGKNDPNWDFSYVTWSPQLLNSNINFNHFKKWIKKNKIDTIFFNEQKEIEIVIKLKRHLPHIKIGSYIDYYKDNTVKEFYLYDFLICNTKRHYSVFKDHPQSFYVPWGTDTDLFLPSESPNQVLTFYHSAGMSNRKGTTFVVDAFINGKIYESAKLIIHTQKDFEKNFSYSIENLKLYNIEVIEKTVTAPGLYYLGDVYVYPTMLDGLGLTMYEALASGLPVITTDHPPMNEVINNNVGYLVNIDYFRSRSDGYYWPLSIAKEESLIEAMQFYINNQHELNNIKNKARKEALVKWKWQDRKKTIKNIFENTEIVVKNPTENFISKKGRLEKLKQKIGSSYIYSIFNRLRL
ncbi:glycosyltransferase family 4 protein [Lentibacillus sp. CBA3610]|uniref:glycosyltransferase family 4 protein n=1 Tax=Lentibacillus sp. CBA3610 TaxID=2518176 RepID=UPI00159588A7|nr:glycosyltransferase family 4 protein [Lentibacillus sp. CBA3610]QKY70300.1 glycosyltransferase [Lentibacillus sp. CBA3610]